LARQLGETPVVADVRWACYARCLPDGTPFTLADDLSRHRDRWWVYQANDLCHICCETLLKFLLDLLETYPAGITLARLIGEAMTEILAAADDQPETWSRFLERMVPEANASSDELPAAERTLTGALLSAARPGPEQRCTSEAAWQALQLLGVLNNRIRAQNAELLRELDDLETGAFRSIKTEVRFLDDNGAAPFRQTIARLLEERVLRRHLWVALRKLRYQGDYTFLFEPDNGRIRLRAKDGPVFTNPRLGPALTFLNEVSIDFDGPHGSGLCTNRSAQRRAEQPAYRNRSRKLKHSVR
jgi:hypothetical protein